MEKILLSKIEAYVVDNEIAAEELIKEAKTKATEEGYELTKYTNEAKVKKSKGEIIASYNKVTLQKVYEKEGELF